MNDDMLRLSQFIQFEDCLVENLAAPLSKDIRVAMEPTFIQAFQIRHAFENKSYECAFSPCKQPQGR